MSDNVQISEEKREEKPYLGGYRDKRTGVLFHHASSQTQESHIFERFRRRIEIDTSKLLTRETQTQEMAILQLPSQTIREFGTQMGKKDLFVDERSDWILVAKQYQTSEELHQIKTGKATIIQQLWRKAIARMRVKKIREEKQRKEFKEEQERLELLKKREQYEEYERQRRLKPCTREDFEIVITELMEEYRGKVAAVKAQYPSPEDMEKRSVILLELIEAEAAAIAAIDRRRVQARHEFDDDWFKKDLHKMAESLIWPLHGSLNGVLCEVETPQSKRATQLLAAISDLEAPVTSSDRRLDILQALRDIISTSPSYSTTPLTVQIIELVDREMDLLQRGRSAHMTQLRLRLLRLMAEFVHTPQFNPAAALPARRVKKGITP